MMELDAHSACGRGSDGVLAGAALKMRGALLTLHLRVVSQFPPDCRQVWKREKYNAPGLHSPQYGSVLRGCYVQAVGFLERNRPSHIRKLIGTIVQAKSVFESSFRIKIACVSTLSNLRRCRPKDQHVASAGRVCVRLHSETQRRSAAAELARDRKSVV